MTEFVRVNGTWLQLAFLTLRKEQREVALLATIDIGPREYFERIVEHIKKREKRGFAILFEDVDGFDSALAKEADAPDADFQKTKRDALNRLQDCGFCYLADIIKREEYWVNADDLDSLLAHAREEASKAEGGWNSVLSGRRKGYDAILQNPKEAAASLQRFPLLPELYDLDHSFTKSRVDNRNVRAVEMIEQHSQKHHVYALWGLDHIPGILRGLEDKGFDVTNTQWMDVMVVHAEPRQ